MVTKRDNQDYVRALSYCCHTTITGWGVLLICSDMTPTMENQMEKNV